ncbi:hypothetical protein GCM10010924_37170 [Rhizobium wenxiniae]|uniref:Uncharacterized protein n=1 Tax=Rhizobium wenxiniae TaxID=1737357 RepID=A0A7W9YAH3_9HYPH|nr:hypothetical protein [Rhizobium wenxiniae]MBB6164872.1 hypothetical protein [Rhizobium wenxiniae]GGG05130.1 hypothetical protein GCM10010924_37170 [Rhizobium wenxiniae]
MAGRDDHTDWRPTVPYEGGEAQPVDTARHIDIGEDNADSHAALQNFRHSQKRLVINNESGNRGHRNTPFALGHLHPSERCVEFGFNA